MRTIAERHAPAALAASFGAEDMVLIDLLARHRLPIEIFTLDTGRLPEETQSLIHAATRRYQIPITVITPDAADIERYVAANGPNAFYDSQRSEERRVGKEC